MGLVIGLGFGFGFGLRLRLRLRLRLGLGFGLGLGLGSGSGLGLGLAHSVGREQGVRAGVRVRCSEGMSQVAHGKARAWAGGARAERCRQ